VGTGYCGRQDYASTASAVPLFAEQMFERLSPRADRVYQATPGPYAGPVSAISQTSAVFVDYCPACSTVLWDLVTGTTVTRDGRVTGIDQPEAASFVSPQRGWVLGVVLRNGPKASLQQRIVGTTDGGRTWILLYRS